MIEPVERYLLMRKSLGYQDKDFARELRAFAAFAAARQALHLRLDDALAWVADRMTAQRRCDLLAEVRSLGVYLKAEDARHEIVPDEYTKLPGRLRRRPPFIYTSDEIQQIMDGFSSLSFPDPFDAVTYRHLVGLIAVTGLRISEALSLQIDDFHRDYLFVRKGKFGKDRLVYLHPTTVLALEAYITSKPAQLNCKSIFTIHTNRAPLRETAESKFRRCINLTGIKPRGGSGPPRLHDLRHTFAVRSLASCEFNRRKVSTHAVALSTHLGHVSMASTFWYCEITAETKQVMAQALEDALNV